MRFLILLLLLLAAHTSSSEVYYPQAIEDQVWIDVYGAKQVPISRFINTNLILSTRYPVPFWAEPYGTTETTTFTNEYGHVTNDVDQIYDVEKITTIKDVSLEYNILANRSAESVEEAVGITNDTRLVIGADSVSAFPLVDDPPRTVNTTNFRGHLNWQGKYSLITKNDLERGWRATQPYDFDGTYTLTFGGFTVPYLFNVSVSDQWNRTYIGNTTNTLRYALSGYEYTDENPNFEYEDTSVNGVVLLTNYSGDSTNSSFPSDLNAVVGLAMNTGINTSNFVYGVVFTNGADFTLEGDAYQHDDYVQLYPTNGNYGRIRIPIPAGTFGDHDWFQVYFWRKNPYETDPDSVSSLVSFTISYPTDSVLGGNVMSSGPPNSICRYFQGTNATVDLVLSGTADVDSAIESLTIRKIDPQSYLFSHTDHANKVYVRNTNSWASSLDMTGIGVWNEVGGRARCPIAVTPNHIAMISHYDLWTYWTNKTVRFVTADNETIERTVVERSVAAQLPGQRYWLLGPDVTFYKLNAPLPSSITPLKVLPSNSYKWLPGHLAGVPFVYRDKANCVYLMRGKYMSNYPNQIGGRGYQKDPTSGPYDEAYHPDNKLFNGDSGSPAVLFINDTPILVTTMGSWDVSWAAMRPELDAAIGKIGGGLQDFDLSALGYSTNIYSIKED